MKRDTTLTFLHSFVLWLVLIIIGSTWVDTVSDKPCLGQCELDNQSTLSLFVSQFLIWLPARCNLQQDTELAHMAEQDHLRHLTVANRDSWYPTSMTLLQSKSLVSCSLYKTQLNHLLPNVWMCHFTWVYVFLKFLFCFVHFYIWNNNFSFSYCGKRDATHFAITLFSFSLLWVLVGFAWHDLSFLWGMCSGYEICEWYKT